MKVLGIGDNVVDYYINQNTIYPGGNALNFAAFSAALGFESAYLGIFGDDAAAMHVYDTCVQRGIDTSHCRFVPGENGCAKVKIVDGDRRFIGSNKGGVSRYTPLVLTGVDCSYLSRFDLIHTSIFSYMEAQLPKLGKANAFISMDCSDQGDDPYFQTVSGYLDCVCISCGDQDEKEIRGTMERIMEYGCRKMVLATRGKKGSLLLINGRYYSQSPFLVEAKDTMGAGDSFITRFLTGFVSVKKELESGGICSFDTIPEEARDDIIRSLLFRASVFAAGTCLVDGSSGNGKHLYQQL